MARLELEKHNPHWQAGFSYPFPRHRSLYTKMQSYLSAKQIIAIYGLRRTGKTVLLKQLLNSLLAQGVSRREILFFSFDEEQPAIKEVIAAFEESGQKPRYIFFDEIQKLGNWQNQLKFYYDNTAIKFCVSGSSSLFIKRKARESLAGRIFDFYLPPLAFNEYLRFAGKEELLTNEILFAEEVKREFQIYTRRQFIETIGQGEEFISEFMRSIIEKIVYIDIPKVFPITQEELLLRLLKIIASRPGMVIEYESLSKELGIDRNTLANYVFYLEEAFLILKTYHFSSNRLTSEKKMKRFYLNSSSFFLYLNPRIDEGKLMENLIAVETGARFFWRTSAQEEVDFVLEEGNAIIPLEVKYKEFPLPRELRTLAKFCRKFKVKEGVMLTKGAEDTKTIEWGGWKASLKLQPAWKYILHRKAPTHQEKSDALFSS